MKQKGLASLAGAAAHFCLWIDRLPQSIAIIAAVGISMEFEMPLPEVFRADEVGKHLGVAADVIEREAQRLGCYTKVGRHMLFTFKQVEELMEAWRAQPKQTRLGSPSADPKGVEMMNQRPFTAETLAIEWGCSAQQIRNLVKQGEIGHFLVGRMIRIPFEAAEAFQLTHDVIRSTQRTK